MMRLRKAMNTSTLTLVPARCSHSTLLSLNLLWQASTWHLLSLSGYAGISKLELFRYTHSPQLNLLNPPNLLIHNSSTKPS
jgi:hypothetical protein